MAWGDLAGKASKAILVGLEARRSWRVMVVRLRRWLGGGREIGEKIGEMKGSEER